MIGSFSRRSFITGTLVAAAGAALPLRVAAQVGPDERTRRILEVAKREVDRASSVLWHRDVAAIADFGVHSAEKRFHFANLEDGTVRSILVSHGIGSDSQHDGWLKSFSNVEGSNATCRGSFITWEWYKGRYGTSIRLGGLDPDNSNALPRAIVVHAAEYARPEHVERYGRLGRSNGCFAMGPSDFREALWHLSGGRLIHADRFAFS